MIGLAALGVLARVLRRQWREFRHICLTRGDTSLLGTCGSR
jgi:hypothetical protein